MAKKFWSLITQLPEDRQRRIREGTQMLLVNCSYDEDYLLEEFHDAGIFLPGEHRGHGFDEHGERLRCTQCGYMHCRCGSIC